MQTIPLKRLNTLESAVSGLSAESTESAVDSGLRGARMGELTHPSPSDPASPGPAAMGTAGTDASTSTARKTFSWPESDDGLSPVRTKELDEEWDRAAQLEAQGGDSFPGYPPPSASASPHSQAGPHDTDERLDPLSVLGGGIAGHLDLWKGREASFGDLSGVPTKQQQELFHLPAGMRRGLKQRHVQMIALSSVIAGGIFLQTGHTLAVAGPLTLLLAYLIAGGVIACVVWCEAELAALAPVSGFIVRHSSMWNDDALACTTGWALVVGNALALAPAELISCAQMALYWGNVSPAVLITIMATLIVASNVFMLRIMGEIEVVASFLKLAFITLLVILSICIDLGAGPHGDRIGFRYWTPPDGPMRSYLVSGAGGRLLALWQAVITSIYTFTTIDATFVAASELECPRRNIPMAAKRVFIKVFVLYNLLIFAMGLVVSSRDPRLNRTSGSQQSVFVIAVETAGIRAMPSVINACVIASSWSAANSFVLSGSRTLVSLSEEGYAPKVFTKIHKYGVPWVAVLSMSVCFFGLSFLAMSESATAVFEWFVQCVASIYLWTYGVICLTSLRVQRGMKVQGIKRSSLPWQGKGQPYVAMAGLAGCTALLLSNGIRIMVPGNFTVAGLLSSYLAPIILVAATALYKFWYATTLVPAEDMPIEPWIIQHIMNPEPPPSPPPPRWIRPVTYLWS